eukprot:scaffold3472_cov332-Pinguiococcus_pyrenoidosus.AAC.1
MCCVGCDFSQGKGVCAGQILLSALVCMCEPWVNVRNHQASHAFVSRKQSDFAGFTGSISLWRYERDHLALLVASRLVLGLAVLDLGLGFWVSWEGCAWRCSLLQARV